MVLFTSSTAKSWSESLTLATSNSGGVVGGVSGGGGSGSFGINYSSNKTDRVWTDNQTSILGTSSLTINTGNSTDIKGALIANATNADSVILSVSEGSRELIDGGNLSINTNSLTFSDISDHEYSQSTGFGISTNIGKGANNNIAGQGTAPSSNPNQQNNYYPNGSTTISANNSGYKKEQTTYATIGNGDITTNSNVTFDANGNVITTTGGTLLAGTDVLLAGLNRDVANSQVMTKDTITNALDVDVTIDNRLIAAAFGSDSAAVSLRSDQENLAGNLIVSNTTLITGTKDIITSAFETNPNDPKNDTYFEVLSNKTALRTNSILNTESLLQSAENAKYYNNPSDNKAGFYDPETGETYINLAYNQSTGSLMETTLHEAAHQQNNLSKDIEEGIAHNYADTASDLINFYHNKGEYSDNLSSQLVSWAYQNSGLSSQYNSSESYLNNFYGISTANVTPASIAVNNFVASTKKDNEVETYQKDVHEDLTYFLARSIGYSDSMAKAIATADQGTDEDEKTEPFASKWARENYHFTTQQRRDDMKRGAMNENDLNLIGQYLHAYQDSFSHQNEGVPTTSARKVLNLFSSQQENSPYPASTGHLADGEWPDKTYNRPELADEMARKTYEELQQFMINSGGKPVGSWQSISGKVQKFNRTKIEDENEKGKVLFR